jgi:hypothetical protein
MKRMVRRMAAKHEKSSADPLPETCEWNHHLNRPFESGEGQALDWTRTVKHVLSSEVAERNDGEGRQRGRKRMASVCPAYGTMPGGVRQILPGADQEYHGY